MKKTIIILTLCAAIFNARAQQKQGVTSQIGITQISYLNTNAASTNYGLCMFIKNDTMNKGIYLNIGFAIPAKNITILSNIGIARQLKPNGNTYLDLGLVIQSDFLDKEKTAETNGIAGFEVGLRLQNLLKGYMNIRLGCVAGYATSTKLDAVSKIVTNNSGFALMPQISVGMNLSKKTN